MVSGEELIIGILRMMQRAVCIDPRGACTMLIISALITSEDKDASQEGTEVLSALRAHS